MIAPSFSVEGARIEPYAAVPTLVLTLRVSEPTGRAVQGLALHSQLRIEPQRRRYDDDERAGLEDLFGAPSRWNETLRPLAWCESSLFAPPFTGSVDVELRVPCSYDLEVGAAKYLHALADDSEVPVRLLFRGTTFVHGERGLEITPLPWSCEAVWRLPVRLWRELMESYYPGAGWLRLRRETLDALLRFKGKRALPSWDGVIEALLAGEPVR